MLSLILAVVMLCSVFAAATSAFAANSGPYSYELINDGKEVKITAYNENKAILSIPSRIAGKLPMDCVPFRIETHSSLPQPAKA